MTIFQFFPFHDKVTAISHEFIANCRAEPQTSIAVPPLCLIRLYDYGLIKLTIRVFNIGILNTRIPNQKCSSTTEGPHRMYFSGEDCFGNHGPIVAHPRHRFFMVKTAKGKWDCKSKQIEKKIETEYERKIKMRFPLVAITHKSHKWIRTAI